jgi:K+-transporting ATPase ATPase C chain
MILVLTLVLGVGYTAAVLGIGQVAFPSAANGSLVTDSSGEVVGSRLIGQSFSMADGEPDPRYFQPRPSAAGDGYDALSSSGSNLGPENPDLVAEILQRRADVAAFNGTSPASVPADALTASGSGLDPHISPEYAAIQVERVARGRGLSEADVTDLVAAHTDGRDLGYLGEPTVNVLELNIALDSLPDGEP